MSTNPRERPYKTRDIRWNTPQHGAKLAPNRPTELSSQHPKEQTVPNNLTTSQNKAHEDLRGYRVAFR